MRSRCAHPPASRFAGGLFVAGLAALAAALAAPSAGAAPPPAALVLSPSEADHVRRFVDANGLRALRALDGEPEALLLAAGRWTRARLGGPPGPAEAHAPAGDAFAVIDRLAAAEARVGCAEHAVVLAAALNGLGLPARVVALRPLHAPDGPAHWTVEAYLGGEAGWAMADARAGGALIHEGRLLSAFELAVALRADAEAVRLLGFDGRERALAPDLRAALAQAVFYIETSPAPAPYGPGHARLVYAPEGAPDPSGEARVTRDPWALYARPLPSGR